MTDLPIGFSGGISPCFVFYIRVKDCFSRESMPKLMCRNEQDDWLECKSGRRNVYK